MQRTVCLVVGARPNFMKIAPVHRALELSAPEVALCLVHTGQHYDDAMSGTFLRELALPEPDVFLEVGSGSHGVQTARALVAVEDLLVGTEPDMVVVAGDVNSTLAAALAAVKLGIPVAHVEAGLRSFDAGMPEEHNRKLTDHVSSALLTHSASADENLASEGIAADRVHFVGNTMIDSVLRHLPYALELEPWRRWDLDGDDFALVTLHRPSLVDHDPLLEATLQGLDELAHDLPVLFPAHPRTRARIEALGGRKRPRRTTIIEPLGYLDFLGLEARARLVITDSGGVQEETSALGTPCFTLRDSTERPVTITHGTNVLLGVRPESLGDLITRARRAERAPVIPLWDGEAGPRAAAVILDALELETS